MILPYILLLSVSNYCLAQSFVTEFPFRNEPTSSGYQMFAGSLPNPDLKPLVLSPLVKARIGEPSLYALAPNISASETLVISPQSGASRLAFSANLDIDAPFSATSDSQNVRNILEARGNFNFELSVKGGLFGGIDTGTSKASRGVVLGFSGSFAAQSSTDSLADKTFTSAFLSYNASLSGWFSSLYLGVKFEQYKMFGKNGDFKDLFEHIVQDGVLSVLLAVPVENAYLQIGYLFPLSEDDFDENGLDIGFGLLFTPFY